ncbi:MAG: UDP-2,3-diacylglucosamine diphosphatase, partial [Muribaculaceae bacterium]|nr:UDP-2,3-diacylglucosamine diphosphatase [Muribaculaceae bacterium]
FYIAHGDGVGRLKPSFRFIRSVFRNRLCQHLYSAIHPRWTIPFAHRWSAGSRGSAAGHTPSWGGYTKASTEAWARQFAAENPNLRFIVLGHHHVVVDEPVGSACRLIVLGDWLHHFSYGIFDGERFEMCRFEHKTGTIAP